MGMWVGKTEPDTDTVTYALLREEEHRGGLWRMSRSFPGVTFMATRAVLILW